MRLHPILSALLRAKTGAVLIVAQVALTLAIVSNAMFVVDQRLATATRPSGVAEGEVFQLQYVAAGEVRDARAIMQRDLETLRAIPGVVAAAAVNSMPMSTSGSGLGLTVDPKNPRAGTAAAAYWSGDSFVDALGLRLIEGRDFLPAEQRENDETSSRTGADTVILSLDLARHLWPGEHAFVGKTVYLGDGADAEPLRVVGVVERLISSGARGGPEALRSFIMPVREYGRSANYAVRAQPGQTARVLREAERQLTALRDDRVLVNQRTVTEMRARRYRQERAGAGTLTAVALGMLLVTGSGIVGISSLWVLQRKKQIGIRRALGATRRDIVAYFVGENLLITTAGVVLGVGLGLGLNQYLVGEVELARLPLRYLLTGVGAAFGLGLVAVLGPAWRAATVPPATATRSV